MLGRLVSSARTLRRLSARESEQNMSSLHVSFSHPFHGLYACCLEIFRTSAPLRRLAAPPRPTARLSSAPEELARVQAPSFPRRPCPARRPHRRRPRRPRRPPPVGSWRPRPRASPPSLHRPRRRVAPSPARAPTSAWRALSPRPRAWRLSRPQQRQPQRKAAGRRAPCCAPGHRAAAAAAEAEAAPPSPAPRRVVAAARFFGDPTRHCMF